MFTGTPFLVNAQNSNGDPMYSIFGDNNALSFSVNTESAIKFFNKFSWLAPSLQDNVLGLYSQTTVGRDLKGKWAAMSMSRHNTRARQKGCVWSPTGKSLLEQTEVLTHPLVTQQEICPDVFWDTCLERINGIGNDVTNFYATPEGAQLIESIIQNVFMSKSNDLSEIIHFSNHPIIETLNTSGLFSDAENWDAYYTQQTDNVAFDGLITQLDALHDDGIDNHTLTIPSTDIAPDGRYNGDIVELLTDLKASVKNFNFKQILLGGTMVQNIKKRCIIKLTDPLWLAYQAHMRTFANIPQGYAYLANGSDGQIQLHDVMMFDGMPVTRWEEVSAFDNMTGAMSYRAMIAAPGVFGIATDISNIDSRGRNTNDGLRIEQSFRLQDGGKIYMQSNMRAGAVVRDAGFVAQAKLVRIPTA
jgi:hypothetical protein